MNDNLTPERRAQIMATFPALGNLRPMAPEASTQVRAALWAEEIIRTVWGRDPTAVLVDPARVPELADRADRQAAEFHRRAAMDGLHYDTHDTAYDPHATYEQGVVKFWRVGSRHVEVVRDRWHDRANLDRSLSPAGETASWLQYTREMLDDTACSCIDYCDMGCTVHLAKACSGTTKLLPVDRGTLVLLFRCCTACEDWAGQMAANTYKRHPIEARADLPPGAVIMPNPEPDVNPDAWA